MSFVGALQTIVSTLQPGLLPNCKRTTIKIQLWNWDHLARTHLNIEHLSFPCPWAIIHVRVIGSCPSPNIILLHIYNLGKAVFVWFILSWIMHRSFSFDQMDFVLHVWYKFLHNSWYKMCFLNFISYSIASLLCFPNLDIKSLKDSQTIHFAKTKPRFHTSMLRWCLFLNLVIRNVVHSDHIFANTM
jgi:hypothetical protein